MEYKKYDRLFYPDDESGQILLNWWNELENDRGGRAELRRAKTLSEIAFIPSYHRLCNKLQFHEKDRKRLALITGLCSHVKENSPELIASLMASPKTGGDKAALSGLRFRKLLAINDSEELYQMMVRIIRLLGNRANICDMARVLYWWNEKTKQDLAFKYYEKAFNEK